MPDRFQCFEELAARLGPLHLALGVFDGVHTGHRAVIEKAVSNARVLGGEAVVVTFSPHPIRVMAPGKAPASLLATVDDKAQVVANLGVKAVFVVHFDLEFSAISAAEFVDKLTAGGNIASISVGEDWRFGSKRSGDVEFLRKKGSECGFQVEAIPPVMWEGERISSTRIRQAIRDGNFTAVSGMLGRPYEVSGTVIEGKKLGRKLGFPTANLRLGDLQVPKDGVWTVLVNGIFPGIANLGVKPTVSGEERLLEVHVFDFSDNLYGKTLHVRFIHFLRDEKKFESLEALKNQIQADVSEAKSQWV